MKGVKHYTKDGKEWKGLTHKMPNGKVHTGKVHGSFGGLGPVVMSVARPSEGIPPRSAGVP